MQGHAKAELVRPGVSRFIVQLLRRHIRRSTQELSRFGERSAQHGHGQRPSLLIAELCIGRLEHRARYPEVEHASAAILADPQVVWFEIAVNDSLCVCGGEAPSGL